MKWTKVRSKDGRRRRRCLHRPRTQWVMYILLGRPGTRQQASVQVHAMIWKCVCVLPSQQRKKDGWSVIFCWTSDDTSQEEGNANDVVVHWATSMGVVSERSRWKSGKRQKEEGRAGTLCLLKSALQGRNNSIIFCRGCRLHEHAAWADNENSRGKHVEG